MKNKIWAYILTVVLILGSIAVPVHAETGTVISIHSAEEYYEFVKACTLDSWSEGKTVRLETDLELTNINEMAAVPYFKGTFDGQGHTVSGLTISYDGSVQGMFRYIGEGGTVKNLNVVGTITPKGSMTTVGGIAGENRGTIANCTFSGVVRGSSTVGGIVGNNEETGIIRGCRTSGIVHGDHYAGGIAGKNSGTIENCINKTNVNTSTEEITLNLEYINLDNLRSTENTTDITDIGGIAGYSAGKIESCTNNGRIGYQHVGYNVGGITGRQSGYVNNCMNYGTVYGRKDIGGINGQMEPYNTLIFSESTLAKLDEQLDELQIRIDRLIDDADDYSDTVTGKLSDMHSHVTNAQNSVETMLDQVQNVVNTDTDTLNELSTRISDTIDKLVPVSAELTNASEHMETAIRQLREAVDELENAADISQDGMRYIEKALDEMEDAQADFNSASGPLENAGNSFADALAAFADALKLAQEGASSDEIQEKVTQGTDALSEAMDALSVAGDSVQAGMEDIADAMSAVQDAAPYFKEVKEPIGDALADADNSLSAMYRMSSSITEAIAGLERALEDLAEKEELSFARLDEDFDASKEVLSDSVTEIFDILDFINDTVADKNGSIGDDIQAVSDQLFAITDTLREAFAEDEEDKEYVEDVSYEDTGEQTEGKTASCTNYGIVEGDVNVGGITGSMAIEYDFDPEDDVKSEGDLSGDFVYQTRAVIRACKNEGKVTAKKNGAGGIVGSMDLGSVIDCYAYGSITSSSGKYTGGIAGYSRADIRHSYAKCTLSGNDYVGGIAGDGNNILQCFSLVYIEESDEYTGAVAGKADGILEENYFVSENLAGVDGISYAAQAEPMEYAEFAALEGMPEEFKSFRLIFRTEDEIVYETEFDYGADLSSMELPELPVQEGSYAKWEDTDFSHMVFDMVVNAVYEDNITALESAQRKNELPVIIVEGSFGEEDRLILNGEEADAYGLADRDDLLEVWRLEIPADGNEVHRIQYLVPDGASNVKIEYMTENGWAKADAEKDGRYLIWETGGSELVFRSIEEFSYMPVILAAAALAVSVVLAVVVIRHKKSSKKGKNQNIDQENQAEEAEKQEGRK